MAVLPQYFWLWLGIGIIILDTAVALVFYLTCRRLCKTSQNQHKTGNKKFFTPSCLTSSSLIKTSQEHANDNAYQLGNEQGCDDTVDKLSNQDNISHSYENPADYEQNPTSGYVDVLPEDNESYDDVISPGWIGEDYDDIAELGYLAHYQNVNP
ncbi:uncharacterized protein LOC144684660 [Cetorhinus maximus]